MGSESRPGSVGSWFKRLGAKFWRLSRGINKALIHALLPLLARRNPAGAAMKLERLGSEYGGWNVPTELIRPDWLCYCIGVGIDATFDFTLASRFGCRVYSFDPTPKAVAYMGRSEYDHNRLTFMPVGVWTQDTVLKFYEPVNPLERTNLSIYDLQGTGQYVEAQCKRLTSIMKSLGHTRIDLLKLDIEGAWRQVIEKIIEDKIEVSLFCVELDSPVTLLRVMGVIRKMKGLGLELVHFEKDNYLFVHRSLLEASPAGATA